LRELFLHPLMETGGHKVLTFMTLSISPTLAIEPTTSCSVVKGSTAVANPVMVTPSYIFGKKTIFLVKAA